MNKEILQRYATLKIEAQKIQNEIEFLQPTVLGEIMAISETQPVELADVGTFTVRKLKRWEFSKELADMEDAVAKRKTYEKQHGIASFTESPSVMFKEKVV